MKAGEVYYWETQKAQGHEKRFKYHVYICGPDWNHDHIFLFISSDDFGGDYRITNPPCTFLTKSESFVSCGGVVEYEDDELPGPSEKVGELPLAEIKKLYQAILNSHTMEKRYINLICNTLLPLIV
jgi:hypothetical protein